MKKNYEKQYINNPDILKEFAQPLLSCKPTVQEGKTKLLSKMNKPSSIVRALLSDQ